MWFVRRHLCVHHLYCFALLLYFNPSLVILLVSSGAVFFGSSYCSVDCNAETVPVGGEEDQINVFRGAVCSQDVWHCAPWGIDKSEIVANFIFACAAQESLLVVLEGFVCSTSCFSVMILLLIQGKNSDKIKIRWWTSALGLPTHLISFERSVLKSQGTVIYIICTEYDLSCLKCFQ